MMEVLQMLKFMYRRERLDFTVDLTATERELSVVDVPATEVQQMLEKGEIEVLAALLEWIGTHAHK
jgi:hypothetical protein